MDWTQPITAANRPQGTEVLDLRIGGRPVKVIGMIDHDALFTSAISCEHKSEVKRLRCPTTGLHIPGEEAPVALVDWCARCGDAVDAGLTNVTDEERGWGWAHTTVS